MSFDWNPFDWFKPGVIAANEAAVLQAIAKGEAEVEAIYSWIGANGPAIVSEINAIMVVVLQVASVADPRVAAAVTLVNAATVALNTLVAARLANENVAQAAVDAYKAIKAAQGAGAHATTVVTK